MLWLFRVSLLASPLLMILVILWLASLSTVSLPAPPTSVSSPANPKIMLAAEEP